VASAKQLEAAAHNLKELGQKLQQTVGRYKV
jgi:methyl-accepting chemotaxis protein